MSDIPLDAGLPSATVNPAPAGHGIRTRKVKVPPSEPTLAQPAKRSRRTGAGQAWNPDNIIVYWVEVGLLFSAVAAAGFGSIDGLLHFAAFIVDADYKQWSLPVAVDVFLVGTALATLSLRKRRAYLAAFLTSLVTVALVSFSSYCNYIYLVSTTDVTADPASAAAPWVKAAMPVLLLAATEIVAALTSTRNNREASPLNRAKADLKKAKSEISQLKKAARAKQPGEVTSA